MYISKAQRNIKHVIDMNNKSMQDIKHKWERDKQSQTRENYFKIRAHLLYVPAFNTMKDFHNKRSHKITRRCNTYNELSQELLDPQEQHTQAHLLVKAAPLTTSQYKGWNTCNHFSWSQKQVSQIRIPKGWI